MERQHPLNEDEALGLAERVKKVLDPESIPKKELDEDPFLGEERVEDYLRKKLPPQDE